MEEEEEEILVVVPKRWMVLWSVEVEMDGLKVMKMVLGGGGGGVVSGERGEADVGNGVDGLKRTMFLVWSIIL